MIGRYTAIGKQLLRDDQHIGDLTSPKLAAALAEVLNGQVLLDTSTKRADEIAGVLWPETQVSEAEAIAALNTSSGHLVPVPSATLCIGCEGNPAPENNPCAVCSATAQQLVPVPSVDDLIGVISDNHLLVSDGRYRAFATAVIAAMQERRAA